MGCGEDEPEVNQKMDGASYVEAAWQVSGQVVFAGLALVTFGAPPIPHPTPPGRQW